jgi:hypothetical protein
MFVIKIILFTNFFVFNSIQSSWLCKIIFRNGILNTDIFFFLQTTAFQKLFPLPSPGDWKEEGIIQMARCSE